jgi:hypothetical protein
MDDLWPFQFIGAISDKLFLFSSSAQIARDQRIYHCSTFRPIFGLRLSFCLQGRAEMRRSFCMLRQTTQRPLKLAGTNFSAVNAFRAAGRFLWFPRRSPQTLQFSSVLPTRSKAGLVSKYRSTTAAIGDLANRRRVSRVKRPSDSPAPLAVTANTKPPSQPRTEYLPLSVAPQL